MGGRFVIPDFSSICHELLLIFVFFFVFFSYSETELECPVALGHQQTPTQLPAEDYVCILCQEASKISDGIVYAALIQK